MLAPLLAALLVAVCGCSGDGGGTTEDARSSDGARVRIVGQNFTEADVVTALYEVLLDQAGFRTSVRRVGARDLYLQPLEDGEVQVAADTLSATAEALEHRAEGDEAVPVASPDVATALRRLTEIGHDRGLTVLTPTRAQLKTAYAVTAAFARRHRLTSMSDLGRLGRPLTLAAGPDCASRHDCAAGLQEVYGIRLSKVEPLGAGSPDTKSALVRGQVDLGQVATTDSQLGALGLVLLTDDRHLQDAENLVPLVNTSWLEDHPQARGVLEVLAPVLTTADLRAMAGLVNRGQDAREVAQDYLGRHGLV